MKKKKLIRQSSSSLEAYVLGDSEWEIKMQNETECVQDFVLDSVVWGWLDPEIKILKLQKVDKNTLELNI